MYYEFHLFNLWRYNKQKPRDFLFFLSIFILFVVPLNLEYFEASTFTYSLPPAVKNPAINNWKGPSLVHESHIGPWMMWSAYKNCEGNFFMRRTDFSFPFSFPTENLHFPFLLFFLRILHPKFEGSSFTIPEPPQFTHTYFKV